MECINSKVPMELISLLENKEVMVGVIDVANNEIESSEEILKVLNTASTFIDKSKITACTNCGLVPLNRSIARKKMEALVKGTLLFSNS